ncbi:hypothetical protein QN277_028771 [Acacia crassicarpa]|uniref:SWIM-type domain-containing protein n=1 Tax=Acacia crassicarpa TaxID=499986 RepID=A0AAE1MIQ8_9FABA|nr:hypothetical protein QN277_028771 [Acacia crassicarpa]
MMKIKRGTTYNELKERIYQKLGLHGSQCIHRLIAKVETIVGKDNIYYISNDICDDEDVECVIDVFANRRAQNFIEIYVELESGESSSIPMHTKSARYFVQEDTPVAVSAPLQVLSQVTLLDEGEDEEDENLHIEEDDEYERFIPLGDNSDTDVEGDFDRDMSPVNPGTATMPPLRVDPIRSGPESEPFWNESPHYCQINWAQCDDDMEMLYGGGDNHGGWQLGDPLYLYQEFHSKAEMQHAVKLYCMKSHRTAKVAKSDDHRFVMQCQNHADGCPWYMRAISPKNGNGWVVRKWGQEHTCVNQGLAWDHRQLDSDVICAAIISMLREDPAIKPVLIQERIQRLYGYNITYKKAWKAKMKAIVKLFGDWEESYAFLPNWLTYMTQCNVGSVFRLDIDECFDEHRFYSDKRVFRRVFWTFHQTIEAFKYCKPILQVDGTHLYGKYKGTLLIATSQDGDGKLLPIAFAIIRPGEKYDDWWWFLCLLRDHVTQRQGICLISDRHASIIRAVQDHRTWQPPYAYHVYCLRHVGSNFNTRFRDVQLKKAVMKLGYMSSKIMFDIKFQEFIDANPQCVTWFERLAKEKWCRSHDAEGRRFGHMTTNLAECVNKVLRGARNLPITALVKLTCSRLVEYFVTRRVEINRNIAEGRIVAKKVEDDLQRMNQLTVHYRVRIYDRDLQLFEVEDAYNQSTHVAGDIMRVDLINRKCQCGRFTARRYPCSHVLAVCKMEKLNHYSYVDPVFTVQYISQVYAAHWNPIGNELLIQQGEGPTVIPNVTLTRTKGRPKSTRIQNEMDWVESQLASSQQRCRGCNQTGHNMRTCPTRLRRA